MPIQITLTTPWSRVGLLALRDRIDGLLEALPTDDLDHVDEEPTTPAARIARDHVKAASSWERLSGNTRDYLAACARVAERSETFSVEDVAAEMGVDRATVLAYHRNVMRTAANAEPASWPLITSSRSGGQTRLSMSKGVALKLRKLQDERIEEKSA